MSKNKPIRIGILGGMGPLAGVELHRLIIEATPATIDQDHLQVVLFTDPKIPDRTTSLAEDAGQRFAASACQSVRVLEQAGAELICIACMTAHSKIETIQQATSVPIINGIKLIHQALRHQYAGQKIALLATNGSINAGIYTAASDGIDWLLPEPALQELVNDAIYKIKAGKIESGRLLIAAIAHLLQEQGATAFVLGCTELGLLFTDLRKRNFEVVDPMRLIAAHVAWLTFEDHRQHQANQHTAATKA
ncbi:MAG TPA: amino acid racemase [Candidatus Acidoferrum sp.]|nr:amino acid racemase [Candidatus Acidoferrum sp.]